MGNKTTVKDLSIGGALACLLLWVLGYFTPEFAKALPIGGEAAIAVVFSGLFSYFKEAQE